MKIELDFAPGLHGHFLELVLNKYIYKVKFDGESIFQSSGAVHAINTNVAYQQSKVVCRGHFSSFKTNFSNDTKKIVFIKHDPALDIVLLTNIYHRCHPDSLLVTDFNVNEITELHKSFLFAGNDLELRNNWFAKLDEHHFDHAEMMPQTKLPTYNFDYKSFFSLHDFCQEIKNTSKFLGETFKFDQSLGILWTDFISRNQGWNLYKLGNEIIDSTLQGKNMDIPNDWKLHAFVNFKLSRIFDLYDGELFEQPGYPSTTAKLLSVISEHIKNFDNRW